MSYLDIKTIQPYKFRHTHIIGQTGTGKSTLLQRLILNDIENGHGVLFIDPHGHDTDTLLEHFPKRRSKDLIVFDISDYDWPIAFNPLEKVPEERKAFVASSILDMFKGVWKFGEFSPTRIELCMYHCISSLLDVSNGTLLGIPLMLTNEKYLKRVVKCTRDVMVKRYWEKIFLKLSKKDKGTLIESTFNKMEFLLADPRIRHTIGQNKSAFDLYDVLKGKVIFARLPQGKLGLHKTKLIGSLLLSSTHMAALSRSDDAPFHIYIDECHHFDTASLIEMLSGIRKFQVSLTLCHQYMDQLSRELHSAVIGNCATTIAFRVGIDDAKALESVIIPDNTNPHPNELAPYTARIVVPDPDVQHELFRSDVQMSRLKGKPDPKLRKRLLSQSRNAYASSRAHVAEKMDRFIEDA